MIAIREHRCFSEQLDRALIGVVTDIEVVSRGLRIPEASFVRRGREIDRIAEATDWRKL